MYDMAYGEYPCPLCRALCNGCMPVFDAREQQESVDVNTTSVKKKNYHGNTHSQGFASRHVRQILAPHLLHFGEELQLRLPQRAGTWSKERRQYAGTDRERLRLTDAEVEG